MSIAAVCDNCGKQFDVNESLAGKKAKCSECGHLFRIPEGSGGSRAGQGTRGGDALAMSKSGSTVVNAQTGSRISRGVDLETKALEAIAVGTIRDDGTAELVEYWIPRTLKWFSLGGTLLAGIMLAHSQFARHWWVGYLILGMVGLIYWQVSMPWVNIAVRKAERAFHFELPALTRQRLAATFGVPTAFGYFFYAYGGPGIAVAGMFFGLFAAFFIMWLVLHLEFHNASIAFACATIPYLLSVAVAVLVLFGTVKGLTVALGPMADAGGVLSGL